MTRDRGSGANRDEPHEAPTSRTGPDAGPRAGVPEGAMPSLVLFDMAGTTVRDDDRVVDAFIAVAEECGIRAERDWIRARMGEAKDAVFAAMLAECGVPEGAAGAPRPVTRSGRDLDPAALAARFALVLDDDFRQRPPEALPGAEAAFAALSAADIPWGLTTGFARSTADMLVRRLGWRPNVVVASDDVEHGRPAPDLIHAAMERTGVVDAGRVAVAGDTPSDLGAGAAAGCGWIIGVGHGTHRLAELAVHPHTHLVDDVRPVPAILGLGAPTDAA